MWKAEDILDSTKFGWVMFTLNILFFFWNVHMMIVYGPLFILLAALSVWGAVMMWKTIQSMYALKRRKNGYK